LSQQETRSSLIQEKEKACISIATGEALLFVKAALYDLWFITFLNDANILSRIKAF